MKYPYIILWDRLYNKFSFRQRVSMFLHRMWWKMYYHSPAPKWHKWIDKVIWK